MGIHNSLVVYTTLFERLLSDIASRYSDSESNLDWAKAQSRISQEGISFLTKTLPRLGKAFDKALQGEVPFQAVGFVKRPSTNIPKFLGWLFERVFQSTNGYIRSDADIAAISDARQLLYFMYKLELPYEKKDTDRVLNSFVAVEEELKTLVIDHEDAVIKRARKIISRVLSRSSPRDIIPKHGPGSVATGETGGDKNHFARIYETLEGYYPFTEYFALMGQVCDQWQHFQNLKVLRAGTAKVVLVPKDSRGPRLISCEPLELQWIQQGQQRELYRAIESHRWTKGQVNFTDQSINRQLALASSLNGDFVTLDMKDASDRVSVALVEALFKGTEWFPYLMASRSTTTRLPDGRLVHLAKFAPMGSAVCFPIEALCFWALSVSIAQLHGGVRGLVARKSTFVYGDDIIVKREVYPLILQHLPKYGLMFNLDKCCVSGFFRESCGCDAYKGVDVTPLRLRKEWSHYRNYSSTYLKSYIELHNSMYAKGNRGLCSELRNMVEGLYGPIPYLNYRGARVGSQPIRIPPGPVMGWDIYDDNPRYLNHVNRVRTRVNSNLQRLECLGYAVISKAQAFEIDAWEACTRSLISGSTGLRKVELYPVKHRSSLKRIWGAVSH